MAKKTILLVDDSRTVLLMERMLLGDANKYELLLASDGKEAVEKAMAQHPDIILMDVVMPHMDGYEACRQIRREPKTRDIPVILVTTRGEAHNVQLGYESGCTEYMTKPFDATELTAKLKSLLGE